MADAQLRLEDDVKTAALRNTTELQQLVSEHSTLDERIRHLSALSYLTHQQQYEEIELKKRKLALKDRIEAVRRQYLERGQFARVLTAIRQARGDRARGLHGPGASPHGLVRIDSAGLPFVVVAALPAVASAIYGPLWLTVALLLLPLAIALFFRDPDRSSPRDPRLVLSPADGTVKFAGPARAEESPPGQWLQVTVFLSPLDVHINRTPAAGLVTRVEYLKGSFVPAYRPDAYQNERSEIWIDHDGVAIVTRQIVGVLARRVVCRVQPGQVLEAGARIGLMKFGSRMDVFVPAGARLRVGVGDTVRGGETVIADLGGDAR